MDETCERCGSWLSSTIHANGDWCPCLRPCAHCGRPLDHGVDFSDTDRCAGRLGAGCLAYAAGRRDGIDEGVRLAKLAVDATACAIVGGYRIAFDWSAVDEAAAEAKGEP